LTAPRFSGWALQRYHYPLNWLLASRLLLPRSGLERSDFVLWPITSFHVAHQPRRFGREADTGFVGTRPDPKGAPSTIRDHEHLGGRGLTYGAEIAADLDFKIRK
jgi:hypothetical protein